MGLESLLRCVEDGSEFFVFRQMCGFSFGEQPVFLFPFYYHLLHVLLSYLLVVMLYRHWIYHAWPFLVLFFSFLLYLLYRFVFVASLFFLVAFFQPFFCFL